MMLTHTVCDAGTRIRLEAYEGDDARATVANCVRLRNDAYLRLGLSLYVDPEHREGPMLTVTRASYQYQLDEAGDEWVFRYDYARDEPAHVHPRSHMQVRGTLTANVATRRHTLERIHFPTGRVSVEAVIRCLADQFGVPTLEPPEVWRAALAESEKRFLRTATRQISGPDH